MELADVHFTYPDDSGGEPFELGPLNLTLRAGETVFLAGGNGSGKTTLVKLLTGLYEPESGTVRLNGRADRPPASARRIVSFSRSFSPTVSSSRTCSAWNVTASTQRANSGLGRLGMADKVRVKREFVLDDRRLARAEAAAGPAHRPDGRPARLRLRRVGRQPGFAHFKKFFYDEVLPSLKSIGKAVLVISHDETYYGAADRLVRLRRRPGRRGPARQTESVRGDIHEEAARLARRPLGVRGRRGLVLERRPGPGGRVPDRRGHEGRPPRRDQRDRDDRARGGRGRRRAGRRGDPQLRPRPARPRRKSISYGSHGGSGDRSRPPRRRPVQGPSSTRPRAKLTKAEADVENAQTRLKHAERGLDRQKKIQARGAGPRSPCRTSRTPRPRSTPTRRASPSPPARSPWLRLTSKRRPSTSATPSSARRSRA